MPERRPQRQMVDMEVIETSGVDHPAHGFEGWLVTKSAGAGRTARLENIIKEKTMPKSKEDLVKEVNASKVPAPVKETFLKAIDLTEDIDAAAALWQSLRTKNEAQDEDSPASQVASTAAPAPVVAAAEPAAAAAPQIDLFGKSLSATEQVELQKALEENPVMAKALGHLAGQTAEALEKAAQERDARLDAEAVELSKSAYKHVAIDHDTVAPALRKMRETDPAQADVLEAVLKSAEGQLEAAGLFAELGNRQAASTGTAVAKAESMAKAAVESGAFKTMPEALAQVWSANPDLYKQYEAESKEGR